MTTGVDATMIKDIVVKLSVGERASPAEDYALSVAATFAAHITGIGFRYYPIVQVAGAPYTVADDVYGSSFAAGNIPPEVIEMQRRDNAAATKAAIDRFATASARAGVLG